MTAQYGPKFWPLKYPDHFGSYFFDTILSASLHRRVSAARSVVWTFTRSAWTRFHKTAPDRSTDKMLSQHHDAPDFRYPFHFAWHFFQCPSIDYHHQQYMTQNIDGATKMFDLTIKSFHGAHAIKFDPGDIQWPSRYPVPPCPPDQSAGETRNDTWTNSIYILSFK